ncbi:hypothetical protein AYI68_g3944 [Smittium mucronatum]|uniref:Uncharacterized protein n=1 Tax=Smittium mucronatum TaxID=133383 RepID=A0A1R0GYI6_9FUNG|nr:hypothetical protein AYI68_g3944 [Smittium mucronatum]
MLLPYSAYPHFVHYSLTENTKFFYSPHGRNNRRESYRGLRQEFNEIPSKEDTRSSISGSPAKLNDSSKSLINSRASIEIDA